ncbi:hypothetical protein QLQ80_01045 [Mycoplasma sp. M5725]|uniref:Uncharacterized protein n=1 Tax=Mycoplasma phocimorsus TaxID=3045839 RepID=A0AAJ1PRY6_9MOLU|nr:hypothetical protein [Mycoplasma phocimorsus]MDJ1645678.1 hypothetical protein [Mycoplasma phocimorsus]MDJ1646499.1 hypothetical protein [Mycoplasma phocimorsus]MDJ1648909.1 hypothetical protein [Mycoplasma phocimorsus]
MNKKIKLMIENFSIEQTRKFSTPLPIYQDSLYYLIQNHGYYSTLSLSSLINEKKRSIENNDNGKLFKKRKRNIQIPFFENKNVSLNYNNTFGYIFSFFKKTKVDKNLISRFKEDLFEISNDVIKLWNNLKSELNDKVREELNIISSVISNQKYLNLNEMLSSIVQHLNTINTNFKQKQATILIQLSNLISDKLSNDTKKLKHLLDQVASVKKELSLLTYAKNNRTYTLDELTVIKENVLKSKNCKTLIKELKNTNIAKFKDFILEFSNIFNSNFIKNESISRYKSDFNIFINKIIKRGKRSIFYLSEDEFEEFKNQINSEIYHQLISNYSFDLWTKNRWYLFDNILISFQKHFDKYLQIGKMRIKKINTTLNNSKETINKIKNNSRYIWVKNNLTKEMANAAARFEDLKYETNWYLNNNNKKINNEIIVNKLFFQQNEKKMLNNNVRLWDFIKQINRIIKPEIDIINPELLREFNNVICNLKTKTVFETKKNLFKVLLRNSFWITSSHIKKFISIANFIKKIDVFGLTPSILADNYNKINRFNKLKLNLLTMLLSSNGIVQIDLTSFLNNNLFYQWINEKKSEIISTFKTTLILSIDKNKVDIESIDYKKEGGDFLGLLCNNILFKFIDLKECKNLKQVLRATNFDFHFEYANAIKINGLSIDNSTNLSMYLVNKKTKIFTNLDNYESDEKINEYDRYVKGE